MNTFMPRSVTVEEWGNMAATGLLPIISSTPYQGRRDDNTPKRKDRSGEIDITRLSDERDPKTHRAYKSPDHDGSYINPHREVFHDNMGITRIHLKQGDDVDQTLVGRGTGGNRSMAKTSPIVRYVPPVASICVPELPTMAGNPLSSKEAPGGGTGVSDDTVLTVGILRHEMDANFNKFANNFLGHVNSELNKCLKPRDDQLQVLTDKYNDLLVEVQSLKKQQRENREKIQQKSQPRRHSDNVFIVDGLREVEGQDDDYTLARFLNSKMKSLQKPLAATCFLEAERVGKSSNDNPRALRVVCNSDWTKRKIFRLKYELEGTQVYVKEYLYREMEDLAYQVRQHHKLRRFSHFHVRKDHVLLIPGKGLPGVKVYNSDDLIQSIENFSQLDLKPIKTKTDGAQLKQKQEKKKEKKKENVEDEEGAEGGHGLKDIYRVLEQTLLLIQATNIRLGLSNIPLPPGEPPKVPEMLTNGVKPMDEGAEEAELQA